MSKSKKTKPLYRVTFSPKIGKDSHGQDVLGRPKEIGAAWARKGDKKGALVQFDIIPTDLVSRNGVMFLVPVDNDAQTGGSS